MVIGTPINRTVISVMCVESSKQNGRYFYTRKYAADFKKAVAEDTPKQLKLDYYVNCIVLMTLL